MPHDQITFPNRDKEDEFLSAFFSLRDSQESRLENYARKLLSEGELTSQISGILIKYQLANGIFSYNFDPNPSKNIPCELGHEPLPQRKKYKIVTLIDRIAESETLAALGYQAHGY